ncbi:MAG: polysaccharide biosynthesis protein [Bacteroidetes bacterium GWA2_31_9]|nr:MAG: polysaccharide biosynthesis protein [Bacteroidetes bacterium GWA2_31_9]
MNQINLLRKNTPSWVILLIDTFIVLFSIILAYMLRFNFSIPETDLQSLKYVIPTVIIARIISFIIGKTYSGIVRFTSTEDAERIFITILSGSVLFALYNVVSYYFINATFFIPFSIIIIDFISSIFVLIAFRMFVKFIYYELNTANKEKNNIVIYGTGETALATKRTLESDHEFKYKIVALIDNTNRNKGKKLEGISILHVDRLEYLFTKHSVSKLIIAKKHLGKTRKKDVIEICLNHNVEVLDVPPIENWINGELSLNQIKTVKIEDLLERSPIKLDVKEIGNIILNSTVLVTGAAGSIGSEIVRQLTSFNPKSIILFDKAESELYDLELELLEQWNFKNYEAVIGNVTDKSRVEEIISKFKPSIVFHAAAYKHVPMMENNPSEAIKTNVYGTKVVADLANKYNIVKFVMISTDKAVNPTNIMGASKRIAEIYIQSLNQCSETAFITTRFGNVLGSNGSVIPRFKKQIEAGGPVTITHPEITRFFMTIPEACQLVLEAGAMGKGGEVYIFDMGRPVKIVDLAKKMIKLSGLTLGTDIKIEFTGLRPGEKLYEELLNINENNLPTHHKKIMIAKVAEYKHDDVNIDVEELVSLTKSPDCIEIVRKMKNIVPEFKSKNSVYEALDVKNE